MLSRIAKGHFMNRLRFVLLCFRGRRGCSHE